jgi:hypothetical protein
MAAGISERLRRKVDHTCSHSFARAENYHGHLFMSSLAAKALLSVLLLAVVMGVILFVTAGTVDYWQASVYLLIFTIASLLTTIYHQK